MNMQPLNSKPKMPTQPFFRRMSKMAMPAHSTINPVSQYPGQSAQQVMKQVAQQSWVAPVIRIRPGECVTRRGVFTSTTCCKDRNGRIRCTR